MNVTEALDQYKAALDEATFMETQRLEAWVDAYHRYADGRPWSQTEAAIRADVASLDGERVRCENNVKATRAELDVAMLLVKLQMGARDVDQPV